MPIHTCIVNGINVFIYFFSLVTLLKAHNNIGQRGVLSTNTTYFPYGKQIGAQGVLVKHAKRLECGQALKHLLNFDF